jgi:hypothetical protein
MGMRVVFYEGYAQLDGRWSPRVSEVCNRVLGEGWEWAEYMQEGGWASGMAYKDAPEGAIDADDPSDALRRIGMLVMDQDDMEDCPGLIYEAPGYQVTYDPPRIVEPHLLDSPDHDKWNDWWYCPVEVCAWVIAEDTDEDDADWVDGSAYQE